MINKQNVFRFVIALVLCQGAGLIGSVFTSSSVSDWYALLNRPSFSPPNWIFGPVWISLYALMAISLFLIWREGLKDKKIKIAFALFLIHLFFNVIWSILFFGLRSPLLALVDIVVLWLMIVLLIFVFYRIKKSASFLLLPYFFWTSFAMVLNFFIWRLN